MKLQKLKKIISANAQWAPPLSAGGGGEGVEPPTKFSKREGLTGTQLLEEGCWERGGNFFQGGCNFHIKIN